MRIALGIEYQGYDFYGWQAQANLPTIQGHLEAALTKVAAQPITLFCAGRTDAGVHAIGQVVHFDTDAIRTARSWILGASTHLPSSIAVRWAQEVDANFHARYSALSRCYQYIIYNHPVRPAILAKHVTWYHAPLDAERMHQAGQHLLGENDFSSFRSAQCESNSPMRKIQKLKVSRKGSFICIEIQANAFLHHMVRNIVGTLVPIGAGLHPPEWMAIVLQTKDRKKAHETAPATGLYLSRVEYPTQYCFPEDEPIIIEHILYSKKTL
jgi:tRNA pseudouridine38-40 synthase